MPNTPASVMTFTQTQCGQNGASSREFQYTVSIAVTFRGMVFDAAALYK
jgi:hypothetical protein